MQPSEDALATLAHCFLQSTSPAADERARAEKHLQQAAESPGYGLVVLRLLTTEGISEQVRQAAAVNFKNYIKYRWQPSDDPPQFNPIQDGEKDPIKGVILQLVLQTPPRIRSQLSEALALISTHDFPGKWPNLLPELVAKSETTDLTLLAGVLETANTVFKRFRYQYSTDNLSKELKYCLDAFAIPLLKIFQRMMQVVEASADNAEVLRNAFECHRLIARIFFSLNFHVLPELFEDHMEEWMGGFQRNLSYANPLLSDESGDKEGLLDKVKAAICENINLYLEKNEEEFAKYIPSFAGDVWHLLVNVGLTPKHDHLATTAIKFLTTISKSVHHNLFAEPDTLKQICEAIIIPNIQIRDEDEELFEVNHVEYIRRDMEGSDTDTRRRMACELVKGLALHHEQKVTELFSVYVTAMLAEYAKAPAQNWKAKDCAIYLVVALTVRQRTERQGVTATNQLVNIGDFFVGNIRPEIVAPDKGALPTLKADALKFVTIFRTQIPKAECLQLFPHLIQFLASESNVVHSYAANCIERMLTVRDGGNPRFGPADMAPFAEPLFSSLFNTLKLPDSQENEYVMRAIMRLLGVIDISTYAGQCLNQLTTIVSEVCNNPANPRFNHYLFEAVALLIARTAKANPHQIPTYEPVLFSVFQRVMDADVAEFAPYIFQILAQVTAARPSPLPDHFMAIFPAFLAPALWERPGNVPGLVELLQAYLKKAPQEIVEAGHLRPILGVFQKLLASNRTDHEAFYILNTLVENLSPQVMAEYISNIWGVLFTKLQTVTKSQSGRAPKFVRGLIIFISLFVAKHGVRPVADSVDAVQPNLFNMLLDSVWAPNLPSITGEVETKLCAVATAKILTERESLLGAASLWPRLLDAEVTVLERPEEERGAVAGEDHNHEHEECSGYHAAYAQLHSAAKTGDDPLPQIASAKQYLVQALAALSQGHPGVLQGAIQQGLQPPNSSALASWFQAYNAILA